MASNPKHRYTLAEYLALERESEEKYEFWNGEVFTVSGGTLAHDVITGNLYFSLSNCLNGRGCRVYTSGMQIKTPAAPPYRYADGSVTCGKAEIEEFNEGDLLMNPILIFEVLSPTSEARDRGLKFTHYKSIPSFKEYLLMAQDRINVSHFLKHSEKEWTQREYTDLAETIDLYSVDCSLPMTEIYRDVELAIS
ncbi:MAG TPA: Uma2 family endonuclease [Blastocatellia bacterium]|nr:Uma2 family endonuclease [Blastocatellia bacterium]